MDSTRQRGSAQVSLDPAYPGFCPWYPLAEAHEHAPAAAGVFQLRVRRGLLAYPRGKSAMIQYGYADELCAQVTALAAAYPDADWLCRHVAGDAPVAASCYQTLLERFITRFGAPPRLPITDEAGRNR